MADTKPTAEYQQFANHVDSCDACEVIPFGPFAGRSIDWQCDMNWEQRAVAYQDAYNDYYERMHDAAVDRACGDYERKHEDTWPEA